MGAVPAAARSGDPYIARDFFTYVIALTTPIDPAGVAAGNVTLDADSDFVWQKFTYYADVGDAGQDNQTSVVGGLTLLVTDTASGRSLSNVPVPLAAYAGNGQLPFILSTPKIFKASGQITVNLLNITDDITYSSVYLCFHGQKGFKAAGQF
jgi:hypothetical protein